MQHDAVAATFAAACGDMLHQKRMAPIGRMPGRHQPQAEPHSPTHMKCLQTHTCKSWHMACNPQHTHHHHTTRSHDLAEYMYEHFKGKRLEFSQQQLTAVLTAAAAGPQPAANLHSIDQIKSKQQKPCTPLVMLLQVQAVHHSPQCPAAVPRCSLAQQH